MLNQLRMEQLPYSEKAKALRKELLKSIEYRNLFARIVQEAGKGQSVLVVTALAETKISFSRFLYKMSIPIEIDVTFVSTRSLYRDGCDDYDVLFVSPDVNTDGKNWAEIKESLK